MQKLLLSLFFLSSVVMYPYLMMGQQGQTLSLSIIDERSGQPVMDAFVFFAGSSVGTISDSKGSATIAWQEYAELVISHLNYETKVFTPDSVLLLLEEPTVFLTSQALVMEEVTVKSSERNKAKRKRWLKRFENAFLGKRRDRRGVKILNPEVILFEENKKGLRAETLDQIRIANEALGYELSFFLDTFLVTKQHEVRYGGKAFFKDLIADREVFSANWEQSRDQNFKASKRHFFRALIQGELDLGQYEFGRSRFDEQLEFVDYQRMQPAELQLRRGIRADTLFFQDFLSVVNLNIVTDWANRTESKLVRNKYATSFLRSRSGRFIISRSGLLINSKEIEELGYWTEQRVAKLLPTDYQVLPETKEAPIVGRYVDSLLTYQSAYPQEKVYLHLDKPYYSINDDIWFKAYLLDATYHQAVTPSSILYVELIDPEGKIVQQLQLHRDQSMAGSFQLQSMQQSGVYQIRAYTSYMRNLDPSYFLYKTIPIYDTDDLPDTSLTGALLEPARETSPYHQLSPQLRIGVFPEGGALAEDLENTLVLHAIDSLGIPLELSGEITDLEGNSVVSWTTAYSGYGLVKFRPAKVTEYLIKLNFQGQVYELPLRDLRNVSMLLHVNNTRDEEVFIKVSTTPDQSLEGAFLIGHVRGQVFCRIDRIKPGENMAFLRSQIPIGVACFSLFNGNGELVSQRLFFNDLESIETTLEVEAPFAYFYPRQKVELDISWADSLIEQGASLSVSVTDRAVIYNDQDRENMGNYLLLNSDLSSSIPDPDIYFRSPDQRKRFLLDLRLATSDWHRFNWQNLLSPKQKTIAFFPENRTSFKGYISKKGKPDERVKGEVLLTALHPQPIMTKVITDEQGQFEFLGIPYLDTVDYILQAAIFDPKKSTDVPILNSKKRKVDIHLQERESPVLPIGSTKQSLRLKLPDGTLEKFTKVEQTNSRLDSMYRTDLQVDLEEVTVRGRRLPDARLYNAFNLNKLDWIPPEKPAYDLLTTLRPINRYLRTLAQDALQLEVRNPLGEIIRIPVSININGQPASFSRFQNLRADMIDFIVISGAYIGVITREQPRSRKKKEVRDGQMIFTHPGFFPPQAFLAPDYSTPKPGDEQPDFRTTVHWEPNLRLDAGGKATLSFYAADTPTEYEVRIEGITDAGDPVFKTYIVKVSN